jgi:hypothetical protein
MNEAIAIKNRKAAMQTDEEIEEEPAKSQMDWQSIWKPLAIIAGLFLAFFWLNSQQFSHKDTKSQRKDTNC